MKAREIVCGRNAVLELLRAKRRRCYEIYVAHGRREQFIHPILALAQERGIPCRTLSRHELSALSQVEKNQGIAAATDPYPYTHFEDILGQAVTGRPRVLLILDQLLDPQNVGSLIRSAHQFGAHGVILPKDHTAPIGPAVVRAAAGATEFIPIAEVTNVVAAIVRLKKEGYWVYGGCGEGGKSLYDIDFHGEKFAVVLGGEGRGLRRLVGEHCDELLTIPMVGRLDSLNVSVAGAVILAEISRQGLVAPASG